MRVSQKISCRESRPSKWTKPIGHGTLLESHETLGVMPNGLSIVQQKQIGAKEREEGKIVRANSDIVTLPRLLRECYHALKLHHRHCPRREYSHH